MVVVAIIWIFGMKRRLFSKLKKHKCPVQHLFRRHSKIGQFLDRFQASPLAGQVEWLVHVREWRVPARDPDNWSLQIEEAVALDSGRYFGAEAAGQRGLVRNEQPSGLYNAIGNRVHIPGQDGLQVDDLAGDAQLLLGQFGCLQ